MTKNHKLIWETAPELLRTSQAATLANVHLTTIQRWIKEGRLPAERLPNSNRWRVRKTALAKAAGMTLSDPGTLAAYADRLQAALDLPGKVAFTAIQTIIDEMRISDE